MFVGTSRASLGLTVAPMAMKSQPLSKERSCSYQARWISGDLEEASYRCRGTCPLRFLEDWRRRPRGASPSHLHLGPMTYGEMKAFRALWSKDSSEGEFHHVKALLAGNYGLNMVARAESGPSKSSYRLTLGKQLFDLLYFMRQAEVCLTRPIGWPIRPLAARIVSRPLRRIPVDTVQDGSDDVLAPQFGHDLFDVRVWR